MKARCACTVEPDQSHVVLGSGDTVTPCVGGKVIISWVNTLSGGGGEHVRYCKCECHEDERKGLKKIHPIEMYMEEEKIDDFWKTGTKVVLIEKYDYMQRIGDLNEEDLCSFLFDIVNAVKEEYGE